MTKRNGRPPAQIDKQLFEKLCGLHCTKDEICDVIGVDEKTLTKFCKQEYNKGFSDVYKEKKMLGKVSLRRTQWKLAEKSTAMAIFLGKNYLGQTDRVETEIVADVQHRNALEGMTTKELEDLRKQLKHDE